MDSIEESTSKTGLEEMEEEGIYSKQKFLIRGITKKETQENGPFWRYFWWILGFGRVPWGDT